MPRRPFVPGQFDHVVLRVRDVATMQAFCLDEPDSSVERYRHGIDPLLLRASRSLIDLGRSAATGTQGRNTDQRWPQADDFDVDAMHGCLSGRGAQGDEGSLHHGAEREGCASYLRDPEGDA